MDTPIAPWQDQRTIRSFKRTFNAAFLIYVTRSAGAEPSRRFLRRLILLVVGLFIWKITPGLWEQLA